VSSVRKKSKSKNIKIQKRPWIKKDKIKNKKKNN